MADEEGDGGSAMGNLLFLVGGLGILVILWFAQGAQNHADIRGIFIHPPAPVGTGDAYGPQLNKGTFSKYLEYDPENPTP